MNACPDDERIDRYLKGRLSESEAEEVEAHYFDCPRCFRKISERNDLIEAVRARGAELAESPAGRPRETAAPGGKLAAFLVPKRWAAAAAAAVLVLGALLLLPKFHDRAPDLVSSGDETVRGEALPLVAPLGEVKGAPDAFEWNEVRAAAEYRVSLSGPETLWSTATAATKAALPEPVRARMKPGSYQWQVKAYSAQGTLLAASAKAGFRITD